MLIVITQTLSERLADANDGSGGGSGGNEGGEVVQQLSGLQDVIQNSLSAINNSLANANASQHAQQVTYNSTTIMRYIAATEITILGDYTIL